MNDNQTLPGGITCNKECRTHIKIHGPTPPIFFAMEFIGLIGFIYIKRRFKW